MLDTGNFGPYRIIKRLGVGGMAETFEATRKGPGGFEQRVCLKRVLPAFSENQEFVDQFEREARLAAQLRHSNIVSIIDFGHEEQVHYMALELVDGIDLRTLLAAQPHHKLSAEIVGLIGLDLAYALDYAHSLCAQISTDGKLTSGIVHRDVSPANVLISRSGEVKLADFGIAKVINNSVATATGTIRGKIPYMAPEQMKGLPTDGRADLFSLGVMLFEAIAGKRPFEGSHDVEVMTHILDGTRLRLEDIARDVPEKLRIAINNLLEQEREKRTPDANALIDQLANTTHLMRARRELAALVEERLGGTDTREHLIYAAGPEDETELADGETEEGITDRLQETAMLGDESFNFMPTTAERPAAAERQNVERAESIRAQRSWLSWTIPLWMAGLSLFVAFMYFSSNRSSTDENKNATPSTNATPISNLTGTTTAPSSATNNLPDPAPTEPNIIVPPPPKETKARTGAESSAQTKPKRTRIVPATGEGFVKVSVEPWGYYWIDGKSYGRAYNQAIPLKPGKHSVSAGQTEKAQGRENRSISVKAGETKQVVFKLEPDA